MKRGNLLLTSLMLLITLVIGTLLVFSLFHTIEDIDYSNLQFVKTETIYIILILALFLFVTLFMTFRLLRKKNRAINKVLKARRHRARGLSRLDHMHPRRREKMLRKAKKEEKKQIKKNLKRKMKNRLVAPKTNTKIKANEIVLDITKEEKVKRDETVEDNRFFMLSEIDSNKEELINVSYNDDITLEVVCVEFRNYAANKLGLYYDIYDIRRFVGSLAVTNILILQGMSGTGKTSLAYAFGEFIKNPSVIVPVQPMWKERTDLIGYYNEFTKKFNETVLLQKLYEANYSESMYITVLDEINIARIEYYFAEFLSLLELPDYNKRNLDVISNKWDTDPKLLENGQITLPHNMWFVGTANNDDSTFQISDKVYDRAMVINLDKKAVPFITEKSKNIQITAKRYYELVDEAKAKYKLSDRNLRRIKRLDEYLIKNYQLTFGNRIMQQIHNYVPVIIATGGSELDALDDILSKKVLRKLEAKNLSYVKNTAEALVNFIEELFGEDEMHQCKDYILHIEQNI